MIFRQDSDALKAERGPLFYSEISFSDLSENEIMVILLMVTVWAQEHLNYTPYYIASNYLFFKSQDDRQQYEAWYNSLNLKTIPSQVVPIIDIDELMNEDEVRLLGKVPFEFDDDVWEQNQDFVETNYEICLWLTQHSRNEPGNRFWYDTTRGCLWFENPSIAANFKLRYCKDGAKSKKVVKKKDSYYTEKDFADKITEIIRNGGSRSKGWPYDWDDHWRK